MRANNNLKGEELYYTMHGLIDIRIHNYSNVMAVHPLELGI